ncbi:melanotransferrin [Lepisosteus oculatus]|uniref:melanotransferrin n=1 Tax=Lepisosteus oculatus TaxID=7918 RepID=UPI0035F529A5
MIAWTTICWGLFTLQAVVGLSTVRWCTVSDPERKKCEDLSKAFREGGVRPELRCVTGASALDCAAKVSGNQADAVTLSGKDIYEAGKQYKFKTAVAETYGEEVGTTYYAVAVVWRNSTGINIDSLAGKRSCHTGLGRTAGWNMPLGLLIDSGRMSVMGCDIKRGVSEFFSASCVPGANGYGDPPGLCQLCVGDVSGNFKCESNEKERYYSYAGAFRCLAEGTGEVAFVKHSTVQDNTDGRNPDPWAQALKSASFQLLCRDGSLAEVRDYRRCHLVRVPAKAVITRADTSSAELHRMLEEGRNKFQMFQSSSYGGTNLMFSDATKQFLLAENENYQDWLGQGYINALKGMDCTKDSVPKNLRWCVLSHPEMTKCAQMAVSFQKRGLTPTIQCVSGDSYEDCIVKIKNNDADAITLDGGFIYKAGKDHGLVPAVGESYTDDTQGSSYYAVAVVKKSSLDAFNFNELKGRRSCHTGYGRTAGWNVPVGVLMEKGMIRPRGCQFAQAAGEFFRSSCVPGANQPGYPPSLCQLCVGDVSGQHKCDRSDLERYYGYSGAFRCLSESAGEVAFVKHTTVFDNTDGHNTDLWAVNLQSRDFQLLCPNGARAEVSQYARCNLARVPAHAVMVRPDTDANAVYGLLDRAQAIFGDDNNPNGFKMFDSSAFGGTDLIFKDSTVRLIGVGEKRTYTDWLGQSYMDAMNVMECNSAGAVSSVSTVLVVGLGFLLIIFNI